MYKATIAPGIPEGACVGLACSDITDYHFCLRGLSMFRDVTCPPVPQKSTLETYRAFKMAH